MSLLGAAAVPAGIQLATSLYQAYQGNKLGKTDEVNYQIPDAAKESLNNAKSVAAMRELPAQSLMENNLEQTTASGVGAIKEMGGGAAGMGAMVDLFANEGQAKSDLDIQAANMWQANQGMLRGALNNYAGYERGKNQRDLNVYDQTMGQSADLKGAGLANLFGAGKGFAQSLIDIEGLNV